MKLKCIPDDFSVTELTSRTPSVGPFSLYRLRKTSLGTHEALQIIQRSWNLAPAQISHGGLKDRHAVTSQYLTIRNGKRSGLEQERFQLEYLGPTTAAFGAADITRNRFDIVVRSLSPDDCRQMQDREAGLHESGFPNYFDQQRFGSLGPSHEFVAAKWCLKEYERALWLALAEHNSHDDAQEREQKQILRDLWGEWCQCKLQLQRSHRRSIVTYLVDHPTGFRKAFALLNISLRGIYLSAFQSAVWNRMLALTVHHSQADDGGAGLSHCARIGDADLPFPETWTDVAQRLPVLPLPSARCKNPAPAVRKLCDEALKNYGMTLPEMKLSFPRDRWFSRGDRATVVIPQHLNTAFSDDDRYHHRKKLSLQFELPRGCYATMLIKMLSCSGGSVQSTETLGDAETEG